MGSRLAPARRQPNRALGTSRNRRRSRRRIRARRCAQPDHHRFTLGRQAAAELGPLTFLPSTGLARWTAILRSIGFLSLGLLTEDALSDFGCQAPPSPFRIQHAEFLGLCRIEKASVSGYERHRLAELAAKSQCGRKVDGVEPAQRPSLDQVARQEKNFVLKVHLDVGLPVCLKVPASSCVLPCRKTAFSPSPRKRGMNLRVPDLRCRRRLAGTHDLSNSVRTLLCHEVLHQSTRVQVRHRRSSRTVRESGVPFTVMSRPPLRGLRLGKVTTPRAARPASRASRLEARLPWPIGWMTAMGFPRSVTTISPPFFVSRRYRVNRFFSSRTPTVLMDLPHVAIVATLDRLTQRAFS